MSIDELEGHNRILWVCGKGTTPEDRPKFRRDVEVKCHAHVVWRFQIDIEKIDQYLICGEGKFRPLK